MQKPEKDLSMKILFCTCKSPVNNFLKYFNFCSMQLIIGIMLLSPSLQFSLSAEVLNYILLMNEY